jgi:hypothetical protein
MHAMLSIPIAGLLGDPEQHQAGSWFCLGHVTLRDQFANFHLYGVSSHHLPLPPAMTRLPFISLLGMPQSALIHPSTQR